MRTAEVAALLYRHDPIGLAFGDNVDEYGPEAESIVADLPAAGSEDDVRALVHGVFVRWFDAVTAGQVGRYDALARELWSVWNSG